jgi:hypothetical protein
LVAAELPDDGVVRYRHWETDVEPDVEFEASRLSGQTPQVVVAKSLGTIVAATAFDLYEFRPLAAILIGVPYQPLPSEERRLLQQLAQGVSTLFIQQVEDPGGSAAELRAALGLTSGEVVTVPGADHLYLDTSALGAIVKQWMQNRL